MIQLVGSVMRSVMQGDVFIEAWWDDDAKVWIATSQAIPGLVVEADSWAAMVAEVPLVIDDLLDVRDQKARPSRLTFRAEQQLDLAAA